MADDTDDDPLVVNLNIPKEVWGDVVGLLGQVFGPAGQAGEWLSDKIRFFRFKSALKTLKKAKEIVENEEITLKEIPIKFLVPFLEKCSLEDEDSELINQWANLLVSAGSEYKANHPAFVDILSQISPSEAMLLKRIWEIRKSRGYDSLKLILELYEQKTVSYYGKKPVSIDEWEEKGFLVMAGSSPGSLGDRRDTVMADQNIRSLQLLERQNLIKIQTVSGEHVTTNKEVFVVNAVLTPLGFEFVSSCERSSPE